MNAIIKSPRVTRGRIGAPRAEAAADPKAAVDEFNRLFEEFKAKNDAHLKEIGDKFDDVVRREELERMNAGMNELQAALDKSAEQIAAMEVGGAEGGAGQKLSKADRDYQAAFDKWFRRGRDADENALREAAVNASSTRQVDEDGGFTVEPTMESAIDRVMGDMSPMRSLATVRQISTASYKKLVNQGGASAGWVGEKESRAETTTPTLKALEFPAMELYAMPAATQAILDDSVIDIATWLGDEVGIEFAEQEGEAFIDGDGVKKPQGLIGGTTKIANASYEWGKIGFTLSGGASGFASSNPGDKLLDLIYAVKRGYRRNGTLLMNDVTVGTVRKWKDGDGNYLFQPPTAPGEMGRAFGYPIATDDFMPTVAAGTFPIAFGDFRRAYLIVDRVGVRVLRDPFSSKPYVLFYTTKRVGGGVQNFEAVKLMKIANA